MKAFDEHKAVVAAALQPGATGPALHKTTGHRGWPLAADGPVVVEPLPGGGVRATRLRDLLRDAGYRVIEGRDDMPPPVEVIVADEHEPSVYGFGPTKAAALEDAVGRILPSRLARLLLEAALTGLPVATVAGWHQVLDLVRGRRPALAALLERLTLLHFSAERVTLGWEARSYIIGQVADAPAKDVLRSALLVHFGHLPELTFELMETP